MIDGVTMLVSPLPGVRLIDGDDEGEDGSVLGFRKGGDEVLFASWDTEKNVPMAWIPIAEFSPEPSAVIPPDYEDAPPAEGGDQTTERPGSPFGRSGPRKRPGLEKE
jgi:hypothetical protein